MKNIKYICLELVLLALLFGCGGSSGSGNPTPSDSSESESDVTFTELDPDFSLSAGTYIAIGCGITSGSGPTVGDPWPDMINMSNIDVINLGESGTRSAYGAEHIDDNMQEYRPSLVMVLYGVNDVSAGVSTSSTIESLEQIIQTVQYYGGNIIVGTIPIVSRYSSAEASDARGLNLRIQSLCSQYGIECADVASDLVYDDSLYLDGFHPTHEGQTLIAIAFRSTIRKVTGQ